MKKNYLNPLFRLMTVLLALLAGSFSASAADINVYGDVNLDGEVTVADVNSVIDVILNNNIVPTADVNTDGEINIADVNAIIDIILNGDDGSYVRSICERVSVTDQKINDRFADCETLDELKEHEAEILALDGVEYVYYDENSMYVKMKEFGTVSYSYFPDPDVETTAELQQELHAKTQNGIKATSTQTSDAQWLDNAKVIIANQVRNDERFAFATLGANAIRTLFEETGFNSDNVRIEDSPSVDFFGEGMFDCDYLVIITHGGYGYDPVKQQGSHWMLTSSTLPYTTNWLGQTFIDRDALIELYNRYDQDDVSYGWHQETRGGKKQECLYVKVSERFIANSSGRFSNSEQAIVFNNACESMKGPKVNGDDTVDNSLALAFQSKGAAAYLGYDHSNSGSMAAGVILWSRLLSGMTLENSHESIPSILRSENHSSYYSNLVLDAPGAEQMTIVHPVVTCVDNSTDNCIQIDFHAGNLFSTIIRETGYYSWLYEPNPAYSQAMFGYGFELSESEQFDRVISLGEKQIGDEGCDFFTPGYYLNMTQSLINDGTQADAVIKPRTTYWVRAYVHDKPSDVYNYSEPISFTTKSLISPIESIPVGNTGVTIEMVRVEGGTFMMGATQEQGTDVRDWEKPVHQVTLSTYRIGQTEVTQALWTAVMGSNPSSFTGNMNLPVESVNWEDCQLFITRLNQMTGRQFRLPTEAEWEFAARGGNKTNHYRYSGGNNADEVAWYPGNSNDVTHPVAQKKPNELGIYDMSGNVWEFCQDWYSRYSSNAQTNPTGGAEGSTPYRIIRGGSWFFPVEACRVAYRNICNPSNRNYSEGFRLAMDAD